MPFMPSRFPAFPLTALLLALLFAAPLFTPAAQARQRRNRPGAGQSYTTISSITVTALSNGVQIRIVADGILQYANDDLDGRVMRISFPSARNGTNKNFININKYPVSHIQVSTPQGAANGIGVLMQINNFTNTSGTVSTTPDGQGVLLTIRSDRTIESARRPGGAQAAAGARNAAAAEAKPDTSTEVRFEKNLLSLRAVKADIHSLMGAIAQKTGLPIAVDDAVNRNVTLNLKNVEPTFAVQSIATANGLALSRIGGVFVISEGVPTDLATYRVSGTESYRMQNTQAANAFGLLPNFLFPYVRVNQEQNAVVVTAPSQMLAKIGQDLNKVDITPPQIAIEALVVEFTDTADRDIGLLVNNQRSTSITTVDTNVGTLSYNSVGLLPQTFEVTLKALELSGKARVRARPQMAVVNGRTADIFIGAQRFILTQFNNFGQTQTRIQPVDVGVKLSVTPLTGGNGEITTRIAPEVSNITEQDAQTGLPVLSTRRADTTVRVKDGETIAIGGLTLNQEQTTNRRIPFFSDLPLIGGLFRSQKKNVVQTELVVFITPRILPPAAATPAPPASPVTPGTAEPPAPTPEGTTPDVIPPPPGMK